MDRLAAEAKFAARRVPDFAKLHALEEARVARWKNKHRKELTVPQGLNPAERAPGNFGGPPPPGAAPPRATIDSAHRTEGTGALPTRPVSARPLSAINRGGSRGGGLGGAQGLAGIVGNPAPVIVSPTAGGSRFVSKVREAQEAGVSLAAEGGERRDVSGDYSRVGAPTAAVLYPAGFKGRTHSVGEPRSRAPGLPGGMAIGTAGNYVTGQSRPRAGSDAANLLGGEAGGSPAQARVAAGENMRHVLRGTHKEGGDEGGGANGWAGPAAPGEHSLRTNNGSNSSAVSRATTAAADRPSSATERPFSGAQQQQQQQQQPSPPVASSRPSSAVKRLPERPTTASAHSRRFYEQDTGAAQQEGPPHAPVRPQSHYAQREQPPAAPPAPREVIAGHLPERGVPAPGQGVRDEMRAVRPEWEKPRAEVVAAGSRDAPRPGAVGDEGALTVKPASFNEHQGAEVDVEQLRRMIAGLSSDGNQAATQAFSSGDFYTMGKTLGEGAYGKVKLAVHRLSGEKVAVKLFEKAKIKELPAQKRVAREVRILKALRHPHVIRLFEVVDQPTRRFLVMQFSPGGDLCRYVRDKRRLSEAEASRLFVQIVDGLAYCHSCGIVHRDVKLDNILMDSRKNIKIVDFGFSVSFKPGQKLKKACGSPSYAAPEIVARRPYAPQGVDVWSLGVVLYAMVCGYFPFQGSSNQELCRKIVKGRFECASFMSAECRDLVKRMLTVDPPRRISLDECATHVWCRTANSRMPTPSSSEVLVRQIDCEKSQDPGSMKIDPNPTIIAQVASIGFRKEYAAKSVSTGRHNLCSTAYWLLHEKLLLEAAGPSLI